MPILQSRDLLCWNSRTQASKEWQPTPGNLSWRPNSEYYPDTLALQAGDIILFQPLQPKMAQSISRAFQRSAFTHAAVYCGFDHELCEATVTDGVTLSSLEDQLAGNCILARRVPGLSDGDRARIAIEAGKFRGHPYGWSEIFRLAWNRYVEIYPKRPDAARRGVICSSLCEHAILEATKGAVVLRLTMQDVVTPARLADTAQLQDVALSWTRLARSNAA